MMTTYYDILHVPRTADLATIQAAYRRQAFLNHPDKVVDKSNEAACHAATQAFQSISNAYAVLSDPVQRSEYDTRFPRESRTIAPPAPPRPSVPPKSGPSIWDRSSASSKIDSSKVHIVGGISARLLDLIDQDHPLHLRTFLEAEGVYMYTQIPVMLYHACKKGKLQIVRYFLETLEVSAHLRIIDGGSFAGPIFKVAAASGNVQLVSYLYETHHADIESIETECIIAAREETALSVAATYGHKSVVSYLLSQGATPVPEFSQGTILDRAVRSGNLSLVELLVEKGACITKEHVQESLLRGHIEIMHYFLLKQSHISSGFYPGPSDSVLSLACIALRSGNAAFVRSLKEQGKFNLFEVDGDRPYYAETRGLSGDCLIWTLLLSAIASKNIEMMRILWSDSVFRERALCALSGMHLIFAHIVRMSDLDVALQWIAFFKKARLIPERDMLIGIVQDAECMLREASETTRGSAMRIYCAMYSLICPPYMRNLMHKIAYQGLRTLSLTELFQVYNQKIINHIHNFYSEVRSCIIKKDISIDRLYNEVKEHPDRLSEALCYYSHVDIHAGMHPFVELLCNWGANIDQENIHGMVPVHVALFYGDNSTVQFYIDRNADLSKRNAHGRSAAQSIAFHRR